MCSQTTFAGRNRLCQQPASTALVSNVEVALGASLNHLNSIILTKARHDSSEGAFANWVGGCTCRHRCDRGDSAGDVGQVTCDSYARMQPPFPCCLRQDVVNHVAGDVGQPIVPAVEAISEPFVVDAHQVQDCGV